MPKIKTEFTVLAVMLVAFGAPLWNYFFFSGSIPLQCGAGLIATTTFFGVWLAQRSHFRQDQTGGAMRDAIAAAFVMTYLVIVAWSSFFNYLSDGAGGVLDPLTSTFVTNFTTLTGVVVASYFGLSAVKQVTQSRERVADAAQVSGGPPVGGQTSADTGGPEIEADSSGQAHA